MTTTTSKKKRKNALDRNPEDAVVVEVAAHEGGRRVATTEATYRIDAPNAEASTVQLVSAAFPNPPLAVVDVALGAGAVKSPTCSATVIGHR